MHTKFGEHWLSGMDTVAKLQKKNAQGGFDDLDLIVDLDV